MEKVVTLCWRSLSPKPSDRSVGERCDRLGFGGLWHVREP